MNENNNFTREYADLLRPDRFQDTDYPVVLEGWSENEFSQLRIDWMERWVTSALGVGEWKSRFSFPMFGWCVGLNRYGEPLVCPKCPATILCPLSFFKWRLV